VHRCYALVLAIVLLLPLICHAHVDRIVIAAVTPEDQALRSISNEQDGKKKVTLYEDFLQKFASNPAAVAYGNSQLSQYYQGTGDLQKAGSYGDKALAGAPHNLDILVSQTNLARSTRRTTPQPRAASRTSQSPSSPSPKASATRSLLDNSMKKRPRLRARTSFSRQRLSMQSPTRKMPKKRMSYVEHFTTAFPDSRLQEQVAQYAMYTLGPGQLNDSARLLAYGEKTLATNPNSVPALLLLANAYVDESKPGSISKAVSYSQKVIALAKANSRPTVRASSRQE